MRIAIVSLGSRGDVQPYVALGAGLRAAGHETWLATFPSFERFVTLYGLRCRPVANAFHDLSKSDAWTAWQRSGDQPLRFTYHLHEILREGRACMRRVLDDTWRATRDADVIVYSLTGFGGPDIAEALGIPGYWAHLAPSGRTGEFPCFAGPTWLRLGASCNRATYAIASRVYRMLFESVVDQWRRESLGLPARRRAGAFDPFGSCEGPVLYGFSPAVIPNPRDWVSSRHITGYWFLPDTAGWQPPEALLAFLDAGPPPIFVSANSLAGDRQLTERLVIEGSQRAGCRLIVQARSHDTPRPPSLVDDVFVTGSELPHQWLFPRVRAVVHHGGSGTVAASLGAGVPSLGIPWFFDHPFWSRRIFDLGVSPPPILRRHLTFDRLVTALSRLANDTDLADRAARLGAAMRAETGVSTAVDILCRDLASRSRR